IIILSHLLTVLLSLLVSLPHSHRDPPSFPTRRSSDLWWRRSRHRRRSQTFLKKIWRSGLRGRPARHTVITTTQQGLAGPGTGPPQSTYQRRPVSVHTRPGTSGFRSNRLAPLGVDSRARFRYKGTTDGGTGSRTDSREAGPHGT